MPKSQPYLLAEKKIEEARRSGATELNLDNMKLAELPELIGNLTQLQTLNLSYNKFTKLPESIGQLTQLQTLKLSSNKLTELPESIGNLTQLQMLNFSANQLTELPESIGQLTQLQTLKLSSNKLTEFPESIGKLTQLQTLNISNNQLTELPVSLRQLTQLQKLDLGRNSLKEVPKFIGQLTQLETLELYAIELKTLPDSIAQLTQLKRFNISNNNLNLIPEMISQLKQLQDFGIATNHLAYIPDWLMQLTKLERIALYNNQLTDLPPSLAQLEHLEILDLDDNPLNPELAAAYEQSIDAVMAYLRAKEEGEITLNEAKLILVGEGGVGKTSLLAALRGDEWEEDRKTTHGVEVDIKSLTVQCPNNGTEITLNGWDFGGQNIYRHTHQLFFTAPAIYLAVWEPRRGPEQSRVAEWIKMVKHRAYDENRPDERPRILVVATHGGPHERLAHIDEQAIRDEFGDLICGFYHVDSKPDENGIPYNLDELKKAIGREAAVIPSVGRKVPISWKKVLEAIRRRSETNPYLSYADFESLCETQGVSKELAVTYAIILNELGHLIYYRGDETLKDTVILKPDYLSKAVSFILEDAATKNANGLIEHVRLRKIWDDPTKPPQERYPAELHPVFLKLMERFDLSYPIARPHADSPEISLMAQLVSGIRPVGWEEAWVLQKGDSERTQVCRILDAETGRAVEAGGLIYRLIVRLHRFSLGRSDYAQSRHWKTGMILDDDFNGRAFIEEIGGDVHVTVRAAYPQRFLGHLSAEIQYLVETFWKGLDAKLFIPCPSENCKGLLEIEEMIDFKKEGMSKVRCSVCKKFHDIDEIMSSVTIKPKREVALNELIRGQKQILGAVEKGFDSVDHQLRTVMSQADEQFDALLQTLTDPAKEGPRLFSFEPVNRSRFNPRTWTREEFWLTLWCEHRRVPLPVLNAKGDMSGVYKVELTKDWVKKAAPVIKVISTTLSLALRIAIPGTKLATDEVAYDAIAEQLEFGIDTADMLIDSSKKIGDWLVGDENTDLEETRQAIRAQGSVLRELHALLKEVDPSNNFGGLIRVQNKRREFLWVHEDFKGKY